MARTTPNQDRARGVSDKVKGRFKEAGGALRGDESAPGQGPPRSGEGDREGEEGPAPEALPLTIAGSGRDCGLQAGRHRFRHELDRLPVDGGEGAQEEVSDAEVGVPA